MNVFKQIIVEYKKNNIKKKKHLALVIIINISWAANHYIRMISEGSWHWRLE